MKCPYCGSTKLRTNFNDIDCLSCFKIIQREHIVKSEIIIKPGDPFGKIEEDVESMAYKAGLIFEVLEHTGHIIGNGHHIAQEIAEYVKQMLKERWKK